MPASPTQNMRKKCYFEKRFTTLYQIYSQKQKQRHIFSHSVQYCGTFRAFQSYIWFYVASETIKWSIVCYSTPTHDLNKHAIKTALWHLINRTSNDKIKWTSGTRFLWMKLVHSRAHLLFSGTNPWFLQVLSISPKINSLNNDYEWRFQIRGGGCYDRLWTMLYQYVLHLLNDRAP